MKLKEIISFLESIAPLALQEDYDNAGLIIGNIEKQVESTLICLDVTEAVLEEAVKNGHDLIISHHPLIFRGITKINPDQYPGNIIAGAIRHNIAVYAIHTNLDNVDQGISRLLAEQIGLKDLNVLKPLKGELKKLVVFCPDIKLSDGQYVPGLVRNAMFEAGAGFIGDYDSCSYNTDGMGTFRGLEGTNPFIGTQGKMTVQKEVKIETVVPSYLQNKVIKSMKEVHPYEEVAYDIYPLDNEYEKAGSGMIGDLPLEMTQKEFLNMVRENLGCKALRHSDISKKKISKVAVCGGAGSFLIGDAIRSEADAFISSDLKYHDYFGTNKNLLLVDAGHYETEQFFIDYLYQLLIKKFSTFAISKTMLISNPINYL